MEVWLFQLYRKYCGRRYGRYFIVFRNKMRRYLAATGGDRFAAIRLFESRDQLPNNYVMKVDKASMSVGVEARTPFLDQRVAEIAYQIPSRHLLSSRNEKDVLRRFADRYGLLPKRTISRGKFGASIAASWIETSPSLRRYAHDLILTHGGWTEILGLDGAMRAYFLDDRAGYPFPRSISVFRNLAWRLLALELWSRAYGITATDG